MLGGGFLLAGGLSATVLPNLFPFLDPTGILATYNAGGAIKTDNNPFFENLGTNGRNCATCHIAGNAFGLSATRVQEQFLLTRGRDPLFAAVDGANCPTSTGNDPSAHSLLLKNGLIRIPLTLPAAPQFTIRVYRDPYGCALVKDPNTGLLTVSVYRRPLPTTNLTFLSAIMWDGRESGANPLNNPGSFSNNLLLDLKAQAVDATLTHAQASVAPTDAQQTAIASFELGLFSSQVLDLKAGALSADGASGGPAHLEQIGPDYYPGTNDSLGTDPHGNAFNSTVFTLFAPWANARTLSPAVTQARRDIAAGETLFNTRALTITSVRGLNDNAALGSPATIMGTCTTCHDTPNVGDHSLPLPLDISTGHDAATEPDPLIANGLSQLSEPDLPVFEITGCPNPFPGSNGGVPYVIHTTDPGKALISGLCSDVNRVKGPILRGLSARAPYFHNGAAHDLTELINFYNERFQMNLTNQEKRQLIAFLNSL